MGNTSMCVITVPLTFPHAEPALAWGSRSTLWPHRKRHQMMQRRLNLALNGDALMDIEETSCQGATSRGAPHCVKLLGLPQKF